MGAWHASVAAIGTIRLAIGGMHVHDGRIQIEPRHLHTHAKLVRRLVSAGKVVVVRNGGRGSLVISRVSDLDPMAPPDETEFDDAKTSTASARPSSWLD